MSLLPFLPRSIEEEEKGTGDVPSYSFFLKQGQTIQITGYDVINSSLFHNNPSREILQECVYFAYLFI